MRQPFFDIDQEKLFLLTKAILLSSFLILTLRSFDLAVIRGSYYLKRSENNRLRKISLAAPRGRIITQSGQVLVDNLGTYTDKQGNQLERERALFKKAAGEEVVDRLVRRYYLNEAAAHLTGYLGETTEAELGHFRCPEREINYQLGDQVGRGGLEEQYDCFLTGKTGEELIEVDFRGRLIRELGKIQAESGEDLIISLDLDLQKYIWEKIKEIKGAVVVLEAVSGQILALVSAPSFEPNAFGLAKNEAKIESYLSDQENTPLLNRSLGGAYPPGSVFKPVVAIAGLEEGKIKENTIVEDAGPIIIGQWQYTNWYWNDYGMVEGEVDLIKGLKRSNDIYFYKVGEWLGANNLVAWAEKFGLGKITGIDLPAESAGLLPSPDWKKKIKGEPWFLGNTYHLAIGQGDLTASPLQIAVLTAAIANGGRLCRPHLAVNTLSTLKVEDPVTFKVDNTSDCHDLRITPKHLQLVQQGMIEACRPGGTGFPFFDFVPQVGCKTGTAQAGGKDDEPHAWFTLFAPALSTAPDTPEVGPDSSGVASRSVVVTVFVEKGGSGAYIAAPIAKDIVEYLKEQKYF
ncbi:hypothetical protein ISS42_03285 [Candidatus Shapirobacteria bacterium]|nr:hypothetical protein [Candidatus Shapirobacteria bacterium]